MEEEQRRRRQVSSGRARGETVGVAGGGHVVRSTTGRKDRHSKVCTAKGLRDRRVRLSAHTAIQFYDVQHRLGFQRPSEAIDWLIHNAKPSIDQLGSWHPTTVNEPPTNPCRDSSKKPMHFVEQACTVDRGSSGSSGSSCFLPPSLDSDAIAATNKSFFPMARTAGQAQELRLSLQSFQDSSAAHQPAFPPSAALQFDAGSAGWPDYSQSLIQRNAAEHGIGGGYVFDHSQLVVQQRGPLQSSYSPSVDAISFGFASAAGGGFACEEEEYVGGVNKQPPPRLLNID